MDAASSFEKRNDPTAAPVPPVSRHQASGSSLAVGMTSLLTPVGSSAASVPYVDWQVPGTPGPGEVVKAYGAPMPKAKVAPLNITRRPVGAKDVQIDILYTGICHTDMHYIDNDATHTIYPCVPGHEVVGRVSAVGAQVTEHRVGDLVAVGPTVGSCGTCVECRDGLPQYCTGPLGWVHAYNGPLNPDGTNTYGGYSARTVVSEQYVFQVPAGLDPKRVAPILCAGLTVYSPLKHWHIGPGKKVGIVGMGGLGHMGVQLATAMGAEVTVFSTSPDKEKDARRFGATAFVLHQDPEAMARHENTLDLVLNCIPAPFDPNLFVPLTKLDGAFVTFHLGLDPMLSDINPLVVRRRSVTGSFVGSPAESRELLAYCAEKGIEPEVEVIKMSEVNDAYARVQAGKIRYRYVIDVANSAL